MLLRAANNADRPAIIELVDAVYREHGDEICLDGADADLLDIEARYAGRGGAFVVMEIERQIVGSHAVDPTFGDDGICTFRRLYLRPDLRGTGAADELMRWAIDWAREHGFKRVEFWSDTRFRRGHRFFQRLGFQTHWETREMHDGAMPYTEYFFWRELVDG